MKTISKVLILTFFTTITLTARAQEVSEPQNLSSKLLESSKEKLSIGGYGEINFAKPFLKDTRTNSSLDVNRLIISLGYSFSDKTSFFTEIEFEHVKELYVEQAFLNHSFTEYLNFRAGLMLIPMGILNEYHEPPTFNGVNRPSLANLVVPTTWREIGAGFSGRISSLNIRYQAYVVNGLLGYSGNKGMINGQKFLRDARQKGAKSVMSSPNFSARVDYYGIPALKLGLSGYFGKTQSTLYNSLADNNTAGLAKADSSVMGLSMLGADVRYTKSGLMLRGEIVYSSLSNYSAYNGLTGLDAPSSVFGWYAEAGYDFGQMTNENLRIIPFIRYEHYDTHFTTEGALSDNTTYDVNEITAGLGWKPAENAVLKLDIQLRKPKTEQDFLKTINAGIGVWF